MNIKEENVLSEAVASGSFTMKGNSDDVAVKTEIKSETSFSEHFESMNNCETATCSSNVDKIEIQEQCLVSDFGSHNAEDILPEYPVVKDEEYHVGLELHSETEIKEEPSWVKKETSSVCDDIKDGDFPPVKSSRLCMEAVSGEPPLSSAEVSGRNQIIYNVSNHLPCESEKSDVREMSTAEEHVLLEQPGKCSDKVDTCLGPLDLKLKIVSHHNNKRTHKCNICGKEFSDSSNFRKHKLIHAGKKPYQCEICGKCFSQISNLKVHFFIHEGKKPYQCKTCQKNFTQMSNLKRHNLIHGPYQCKICHTSFTLLSDLRTHILIHEGKKPHQCKTCGKSYSLLSSLKRHNLAHEGKNVHQCKTCDTSFTQLSSLKRHNWIHEGKKPHQCNSCGKSFTQLSYLKTHNLIHEGKKPHHG